MSNCSVLATYSKTLPQQWDCVRASCWKAELLFKGCRGAEGWSLESYSAVFVAFVACLICLWSLLDNQSSQGPQSLWAIWRLLIPPCASSWACSGQGVEVSTILLVAIGKESASTYQHTTSLVWITKQVYWPVNHQGQGKRLPTTEVDIPKIAVGILALLES